MAGLESIDRPCNRCGERLDPGAFYCASCGTPVHAGPREARVTLEFRGTTSQAYVWVPWWILLSLLVIPAGWGTASLSRWYVRNLWFSDGTEAWFEGTGGQIWWYFVIRGALSAVANFIPILAVASTVASVFVDPWIDLAITRWFVRGSRLSSGTRPGFTGTYWPFLAFYVLLALSLFTIIGWAWVMSAFMRWICRNLAIGAKQAVFVGSGWEFLWRGIASILCSIPIVTIPWAWVWFMKWFTRCVVFEDGAALGARA